MKNLLHIATISLLLLVGACSRDNKGVQIRIKNTSPYPYTDVTVNIGSNQHLYGTIQANNISDYKTFDYAYRYANVTLQINGQMLRFLPIDYVGENKLAEGKYIYEINANTTNKLLTINLVKE